jgi:hypothetical protein
MVFAVEGSRVGKRQGVEPQVQNTHTHKHTHLVDLVRTALPQQLQQLRMLLP